MIAELRGIVLQVTKDSLVVDFHGLGLSVFVTPGLLGVTREGSEIHLYTRLIVKEDGWSLYGFSATGERTCFDLLLTVKGIGPRIALGILSKLRPDAFYKAVIAQDERALTGLPGVGKKTAGRIVLELRDRIGLGAAHPADGVAVTGDLETEACSALVALGYSWQEARDSVEKALKDRPGCDLETLLREALMRLARV